MMARTLPLAAACALLVAATIHGDEPVVPSPAPVAVPTPLPSPPPPPRQATRQTEPGLARVEHLHRAAEHLEAAGAEELAREIREEADAMLEASVQELKQKREQVARLLREIVELEEITGQHHQIMLKCRVVDVDITKVRQLGFSWSSVIDNGVLESESAGSLPFRLEPGDAAIMDGFIDALVREDLARVLAEPVLITTNGRPANLHSGGEFPVLVPDGPDDTRIEFREFGLRLEAVPSILNNGRVRLSIAPELSARDFENAVTLNGIVVPGLHTRRMNTQVDMEFGETITLVMPSPGAVEKVRQTSAVEDGEETGQTVTIFCVTPERVKPVHGHPVPHPQPADLQEVPAY